MASGGVWQVHVHNKLLGKDWAARWCVNHMLMSLDECMPVHKVWLEASFPRLRRGVMSWGPVRQEGLHPCIFWITIDPLHDKTALGTLAHLTPYAGRRCLTHVCPIEHLNPALWARTQKPLVGRRLPSLTLFICPCMAGLQLCLASHHHCVPSSTAMGQHTRGTHSCPGTSSCD